MLSHTGCEVLFGKLNQMKSKPLAPYSNQLGLGFETGELPTPARLQTAKAPTSKTLKKAKIADAFAALKPETFAEHDNTHFAHAAHDELETLALKLEGHPDYRVLRRLAPTKYFQGQAQGPLMSILVLDTETTGLDVAKEKMIELAMLRVTVDTVTGMPIGAVHVYDGLEDPGHNIPPGITGITGITDAMVRGKCLDEVQINQMTEGVDLVVAHNAGFDRPFVEARLPRFALLPWSCSFADLDWRALGQSSAKLEQLALACGWFYDAHRAETDCHALLSVLAQPQARFGHSQSCNSVVASPTGLSLLLAAAGETHHRLQATSAPFEAKDALKSRGYRWDGQQRVWGITLRSDASLDAELTWLADAVYNSSARVRVETLTSLQRYSSRSGSPSMREVGTSGLGF